jgi:FAD/FMN-containing dehydrogenase
VLVELSDTLPTASLCDLFEQGLAEAFERVIAVDGVVASGSAQVTALWSLREGISEAQNREGPSLKHDITEPVSSIPAFIEQGDLALGTSMPGVRMVTYGNIGDGNLHYNLSNLDGADDEDFRSRADVLSRIVYDTTSASAPVWPENEVSGRSWTGGRPSALRTSRTWSSVMQPRLRHRRRVGGRGGGLVGGDDGGAL